MNRLRHFDKGYARWRAYSCNCGQTRLFGWLRRHGYLFRRERRPIQKWVERGLFDTTVRLVATADGPRESLTTKVTPRGQRYFIEGFLGGRFQLP